ncbi:MAG: hypothetical protein QNJ57_05160 [Flavobacteriaceae bacterium]|nr:hypothetical protein [Flavobacteriaceae bacterium]
MNKIILFLFCASFFYLSAQNNYYQPELSSKDYKGVLKKANTALKKNTKDSMAYYYKGWSQMHLEKHEKAIESLLKAKKYGLRTFALYANLSKNYMNVNEVDKALNELEETADAGSAAYRYLENDDFKSLFENERFKSIKQKMYANFYPCKFDEKYRKFDFWIGEWEVYIANGKGPKIAESSITLSNGDCGILENYRPFRFAGGNSISYYDSTDKRWKQEWIAGGSTSHYVEPENYSEGNMQLIAPAQSPQGKPILLRMIYYKNDDGSVRQLMESSSDEGKNWTPVFDGLYKKKIVTE